MIPAAAASVVPQRLLALLECPECSGALDQAEGHLACTSCAREVPVIGGIPRFVPGDSYAASFGLQWNRYRTQQLDSKNGTNLSATRFFSETDFSPAWLGGKVILDAGCGAGRFAEVAAEHAAHVVAVDISSAVDAARLNMAGLSNVDVVQASIDSLPFRDGAFDAVYCIGVLQHTPDPQHSARALPRVLKPGGRLAITVYERKRQTRFNGKYLIRPLTRRLSPRVLGRTVSVGVSVLFPLTELLYRVPFLGRGFRFVIPVANYVGLYPLTLRQRYEWALLDTFDMLAPRYDQPLTEQELSEALRQASLRDIQRLNNPGLNLIGSGPIAPRTRE